VDLKTLIDSALLYTWGSKPTDAFWPQHRARALLRAQEQMQGVWDFADWDFKQNDTQLRVPASPTPSPTAILTTSGVVACPQDFDIIGDHGGAYCTGQHIKMTYQRPEFFFRKRELYAQTSGQLSYWYTVYAQNSILTPNLFVYPAPTADLLVNLYYQKRRPTLIDIQSFLPPSTAPTTTLLAAAGNLGVGNYTYLVTFVGTTLLGVGTVSPSGETMAGAISSPTLGVVNPSAAGQVQLSNIPLGPSTGGFTTTARNIYRTIAGGSGYYLLGTITDNVTTVFTDNVADSSLGVQAPVTSSIFSGLEFVPYQYHESVILRGLIELLAYDTGDARSQAEAKERAVAGAVMMKSRRIEQAGEIFGMGDDGVRTYGMW
jgi:hypothetical protein